MTVRVNHREIELWAKEALLNIDELERKIEKVRKVIARRVPWWRKLNPRYLKLMYFGGIERDLIGASRIVYKGYLQSIEKMQKVESHMSEKEYEKLLVWRGHANQVVEILSRVNPRKKLQGPFR